LKWSARVIGVKRLQQRYGTLFTRPFFLLAQLFGVSFNTGVLAATLLKVIGSDVAFGWQTTLQIQTDTVRNLVQWISLPWSWLLPASCCPSPAQIEGSKLILKDGIYRLATNDLTSWWPFLCLSVLFYGLLPRLVLFLVGLFRQHRDLLGLRFEHGRYRQLVHRMRTPLVLTRAPAEPPAEPGPEPDSGRKTDVSAAPEVGNKQIPPEQEAEQPVVIEVPRLFVLVPDELFEDFSQEKLEQQVRTRLGYEVAGILPFWTKDLSEEEDLARLKEQMNTVENGDLMLLQEAWQPPIQELLSILGRLRQTLGEQPTIIIALTGKPRADTMLTPVDNLNLQVWRKKIATVDNFGLQLIELVK
jgi:hypothetical protein